MAVALIAGVVFFLKSRNDATVDTAANEATKALTSTTVKQPVVSTTAAPVTTTTAVGQPTTTAPTTAPVATTAQSDAKFVTDTRAAVPGITQTWTDTVVVAAGNEVCAHARSGANGKAALDVLINIHHVQLDDDQGRFARMSITTYCPDQQQTVNDAIAFNNLVQGGSPAK